MSFFFATGVLIFVTNIDTALMNLLLSLLECYPFLHHPLSYSIFVWDQVLNLLDFKNNRAIKLVKFSHFLLLEVCNFIFCLKQVLVNSLLS